MAKKDKDSKKNQEEQAQDEAAQQEQATEEISKEEALQKQLDEMKDKHLRLFAEFDNFRKRTARERIELQQVAGKELMIDLLAVVDDFERAKKSMDESKDINAVKEGVDLIYNKLYSVLSHKGVKPMESIGKDFDADKHEAVTEIPAPSEDMKGKVIDEVEKGYLMNDKIIRYAKVVVGK